MIVNGANNTYKTARVIGDGYNLMYAVWCTNEHELYEMDVGALRVAFLVVAPQADQSQSDPYQMINLYENGGMIYDWDVERLTHRLDTLLLTLKQCSGRVCSRPWEIIHPAGDVSTLQDAMRSDFDDFYGSQPRVSFSRCAPGYLTEFEGALGPKIFES